MYAAIIVIHIIVSIFLIAVILLQAGRGGGLADSFGGSQMQNLFGTKSASVLTKLTTVCATVFIITCISLAVISSHRSKSIMDKMGFPEPKTLPAAADVEKPMEKVDEVPVQTQTEPGEAQ